MQTAFDFGARADIARIRRLLAGAFGIVVAQQRLEPAEQLVRSLIGSRTRDAVSWAAFQELRRRYPDMAALAAAQAGRVEEAIAPVTFADRKARQLVEAVTMLRAADPHLRFAGFEDLPAGQASARLERLPGVGTKVAAATLNFSTLGRPVFVVDTHVLRVLRRLGLVGAKVGAARARDAVMEAAEGWGAQDFVTFHALLKRHGQVFCRPLPQCRACPLRAVCRAAPPVRKRG